MARLPYLRSDEASPEVRAALEAYPPHVRDKNVWGILSHAEEALVPMVQYGRALATRSAVELALRELAIVRVARLTPGADYIWTEHHAVASSAGVTEAQLATLAEPDPDPEVLGPDGELVVGFTDQFVRTGTVDETTWTRMTQRFSSREIVELILVIGHFHMFSRLHATVRTDLERP